MLTVQQHLNDKDGSKLVGRQIHDSQPGWVDGDAGCCRGGEEEYRIEALAKAMATVICRLRELIELYLGQ